MATVRAQASWRPAPPWAITAEAIWSPMENTGLREVIGSWKTMAICAPRTRRIASASLASRSSPSKSTRPAATRPGGGTSRMMDSEVTLFPQPLSPTSPRTSPRPMAKLTPSTARSTPCAVAKWVSRPCTSRSADMSDLETRIERIAQPVAEKIDGQHGQHDREPGEGGEPPRGGEVVPSIREHPAPGGRGRLHAEPEEGQGRLVDDHEGQLQGGHDDDRGQRVGQHVAEEETQRPVAARRRSQPPRLPGGRPQTLHEHLARGIPRGDLGGEDSRPAHDEKHGEPEDSAEARATAGEPRRGLEGRHCRGARRLAHRARRTKTMRGSR